MAKRKAKKKTIQEFMPDSMSHPEAPFSGGGYLNSDRRIGSCADARQLYSQLYLENQLRAQVYAQVRNQIEGGRPFDPDTLQRNGESWRTNVNFRDAEAMFLRAYTPHWKMIHEVPRTIACKIHTGAPEAEKWGISMAEAFDMFLDDWGPDYLKNFMGFARDYVKYGPGYVMWPDDKTPRYKWAPTVQMYFPKRTKANVDEWELVCLRRDMTASELIEKVLNQKEERRSSEAGWNPEGIKAAIRMAAPGPWAIRYLDPNYWQDMIVANDLVIGGIWPTISVVDCWAKQRDGKTIQHYIFTEKSDVSDYLYENKEESETFRHIFGTAFYDIGENGLLHTVKGFAVKNYYYANAINRTKCRLLDSATFAMGMNFVKGDNTPEESPPVESYSMVNVFPAGLTQMTIYPQIKAASDMMLMLRENQNENNYAYNDSGTRQNIAQADTATQGELIARIGAEGESANAAIWLSQVGKNLFSEMFRRLRSDSTDPDAKKFVQRCQNLGVPIDVIRKAEITVKTGASPSMASAAVRGQIATTLMQAIYPLPGANRRAIEEFFVANATGSEGVDRYLLPIGTNSDPRARREAMMENVDMAQSVDLPVDPSDAHVEHADEHLKPMEMIVAAVKSGQQITPDHLIPLQLGIPHTAQHLAFMEKDETKAPIYRELKARLSQVTNIANGIMARLARAQSNGASPETIMNAARQPMS